MSVRRLSLFGLLLACMLSITHPASAVTGSDWQAGRIIDDAVFNNGSDMTLQQIQEFLDSKVPVCDTQGTQTSEYGGGTRAQWGTARGFPPPYICLKDYFENPSTHESNLQTNVVPSGAISAARIIYLASQTYSVNPKVILATLQKESVGPLVTDSWPFWTQYRTPMGYACPDTAPCNSQYYGFYNQVNNAAAQFRRYANNPTNYRYKAGQINSILYNPNSACGSSNVFIQNQGTANLYNYTPYQPNQAALNNLYGGGDSCSSHGNLNFWRIFSDWFGSTILFNGTVQLSSGLQVTKQTTAFSGDVISGSYSVSNTASYPVDVGGLGICARLNGLNYDFGFQNMVSLGAGQTKTISYSRKIDKPGMLTIFICSYNEHIGGWAGERYPYDTSHLTRQSSFEVRLNPLITTSLSLSPPSPTIGQSVTASFVMRNNSSSPVTISAIGVAARDPLNRNVGFAADTNVTIAANSTYSYSKTRIFTDSPGNYQFWITSLVNNVWNDGYPLSASGVARNLNLRVYDNPAIITGLSLSPVNPSVNQPVTATFTVRNNGSTPVTIPAIGVAARDSANNNVGFASDTDVTIAPNSSYSYSKTRTFTGRPGIYHFWITSLRANGAWDDNYPAAIGGQARSVNQKIYDNPIITTGIILSPANPRLDQAVTATFTVTNNSTSPVTIPVIGLAVRDASGANVGFPADTNVTIAPNTTYTYSKTRTFTANPGAYKFWVTSFVNNTWNDNYPAAIDGQTRQFTLTIQ